MSEIRCLLANKTLGSYQALQSDLFLLEYRLELSELELVKKLLKTLVVVFDLLDIRLELVASVDFFVMLMREQVENNERAQRVSDQAHVSVEARIALPEHVVKSVDLASDFADYSLTIDGTGVEEDVQNGGI